MQHIPQYILLGDLLQGAVDTHLVVMLRPKDLLALPLHTDRIPTLSKLPGPIKHCKSNGIRCQKNTRHSTQRHNRLMAIPFQDSDYSYHLKQRTHSMHRMMDTMHPPFGSSEIHIGNNTGIRTLGQKHKEHPN